MTSGVIRSGINKSTPSSRFSSSRFSKGDAYLFHTVRNLAELLASSGQILCPHWIQKWESPQTIMLCSGKPRSFGTHQMPLASKQYKTPPDLANFSSVDDNYWKPIPLLPGGMGLGAARLDLFDQPTLNTWPHLASSLLHLF